ncbi:import inner membrane translocase subunit tim-21, mitochondrial [Teratosphaeria nubilosa]|uniref:Mitochondrial import inner membrane translocase subunit Tim21 n=1 Tax=Teratosphaeria nubilosa TaxID=161662 RepID=A0A6G1LNK5_9PEZI|nr:import inner membrane translocase subunit tim-21, mitochondrial [Teratosphaeria nubilosa]
MATTRSARRLPLLSLHRPVTSHNPPSRPLQLRPATTSQLPPSHRRRSVTVANDDGHIPWRQLSLAEKAARTTQQSFHLGVILLGVGLTGTIAYVLYLEVFSADSKTAVFNRAADRIKKDPKCLELLAGPGYHTSREIKAYGEPSWSRWARNRSIASRHEMDRAGVEHTYLHFYVEGPVAKGTVQVHVVRRPGEHEWEYRLLALDVLGQQRHYLENADASLVGARRGMGKMFGVKWNR